MSKAIVVLLGLLVIGVGVLQFRQQSLAIRYRSAQVHREIQKSQANLWRQQVEIAAYTSPQVMQSIAATFQRSADSVVSAGDLDAARE